jgi:hypothetical protein
MTAALRRSRGVCRWLAWSLAAFAWTAPGAMAAPPQLTTYFVPFRTSMGVGDGTQIVINMFNPTGADIRLTAPFVDAIPPPLVASSTNIGTCEGVLVTSSFIVWPAGNVVPRFSCQIVVSVTAASAGTAVNTTGPFVTDAGTAAPASATMVVTGTYALYVTAGNGQATLAGTPFGTTLAAQLTLSGAAVPGAAVTFRLPDSGPSGTFAGQGTAVSAITDANGIARSPIVIANGVAGAYHASVSADAVPQPREFALENVASTAPGEPIPATGVPALLLLAAGVVALARRRRAR